MSKPKEDAVTGARETAVQSELRTAAQLSHQGGPTSTCSVVSGKPLPTPSGCILALPLLLLPGIAMSVWTLFRGEDKENK